MLRDADPAESPACALQFSHIRGEGARAAPPGGRGSTAHAQAARGPPGTRPAGGGARTAHRPRRGAQGVSGWGGKKAGRRDRGGFSASPSAPKLGSAHLLARILRAREINSGVL